MSGTRHTNENGPGPCGPRPFSSGAEESRTPDLFIANEALYQLSYRPERGKDRRVWARARVMAAGMSAIGGVVGLLILCLSIVALSGCKKEAARPAGAIGVVVTVPPLAGLVRPLLPENVEVKILMGSGHSEHGYEFSPEDIGAVGRADVVICVGTALEPGLVEFLEKHPDPKRRSLRFFPDSGVSAGKQVVDPTDTATPDPHDVDAHLDPHFWLDPELCRILVNMEEPAVKAALEAAGDGRGAAAVHDAADKLRAEIRALDEEYKSKLAPFKGRSIVTHHNAWSRLAHRYGLTVAAVMRDIDEGEMTAEAVNATVDAIRKQGVKAVFIEPQYDRGAAERIAAAAGVRVATLDPLGDGDWFKMMRANLESLVKALGD